MTFLDTSCTLADVKATAVSAMISACMEPRPPVTLLCKYNVIKLSTSPLQIQTKPNIFETTSVLEFMWFHLFAFKFCRFHGSRPQKQVIYEFSCLSLKYQLGSWTMTYLKLWSFPILWLHPTRQEPWFEQLWICTFTQVLSLEGFGLPYPILTNW